MTDRQQQAFNDLFTKYGSPLKEHITKTIYISCEHPENIDTVSRIMDYDKSASDKIKELQAYIEELQSYRIALSERYNYIETAPTIPVIKLKRERSYYQKKVYYYLTTYSRDLNTNKDTLKESKKYPGTERKQAIQDFNTYIATHPGIISELDIVKPAFER